MKTSIIIGFCLIFWVSKSFAQESMIDSIKQLKNHAEKTTVLDDLLSTAKTQEQAPPAPNDMDKKTQKIVSELKNPFVPQLPVKETPPPPKPPEPPPAQVIVETPQPTPTPEPEYTPPPPEKPNLKISGLVWNTVKPQAILNGQIVTIGDVVEEWQVTSISKDGVEIQKDDQKFTIEQNNLFKTLEENKTDNSANPNPANRNSPTPPTSVMRDRNLTRQSQQQPRLTNPTSSPARKTQSFQYEYKK
jgi:hypothetical protein